MTGGVPPRRRGRPLDDSERRLWHDVTRTVRPLRPGGAGTPAADVTAGSAEAGAAGDAPSPAPAPARPLRRPPSPTPPPLAPLGRRLRQRIARSTEPIRDRIDLHGLTQAEAHDALLAFLRLAQGRGCGLVLVITGKGARADFGAGGDRGILRRLVPHWLALPAFRDLIVGFEVAHPVHGGEGALYVRLRRRRRPS
jgi:DNA-nicking Smr family endonuclease